MANRVVVQPNGLFARFSDVVDGFTHMNCTEGEMLEIYCFDYGEGLGPERIARAKQNPQRFTESIATIRAIHGDAEAERVVALATQPQEAPRREEKIWLRWTA